MIFNYKMFFIIQIIFQTNLNSCLNKFYTQSHILGFVYNYYESLTVHIAYDVECCNLVSSQSFLG